MADLEARMAGACWLRLRVGIHLAVVRHGSDSLTHEMIHRIFHRGDSGRECGDRGLQEVLSHNAELAVFRPELVAPFGNAMCLIDGKARYRDLPQPAYRPLGSKRLLPDEE